MMIYFWRDFLIGFVMGGVFGLLLAGLVAVMRARPSLDYPHFLPPRMNRDDEEK